MIWLTKLLKNIDGFYTKATGDVNLAETREQMKARLREEALRERELEKEQELKQQETFEIQEQKQNDAESVGRKALQKLNSINIPDPLHEDFNHFMRVYTEIFTLVNDLKPNMVSEKLNEAYQAASNIKNETTSYEDDIKTFEEKATKLAQFAKHHIVLAVDRLLNNPYLRKSKTAEDAAKELSGQEDPTSPMWQDYNVSALEFVELIDALGEDAQETAIYALGGIEQIVTLVQADFKEDEDRRTNMEGEGLGEAIQQGFRPMQDKQQAVNRAVSTFKANCREALRFEKNNNFHEHIASARIWAAQRKRYEEALKADPVRHAKQLEKNRKNSARYRERMVIIGGIKEAWDTATTPTDRNKVFSELKSFYRNKLYTRGLDGEALRAAEAMLPPPEELLKKSFNELDKYNKSLVKTKEKINIRNRESKTNRGIVDLATIVFGQKINSRPSDMKRTKQTKELFRAKLASYENTQLVKYNRDIELAHEKIMNATNTMDKVKAEMELNNAKANLAKAESAIKDQLDPVEKVRYHVKKLKEIQKMVKELIKMGIIDNNGLVQPERAPLVKIVVDQGYQLLSEYPFQDMVEATVGKELLDKLSQLISDNPEETQEETQEYNIEELTPPDIDLTEKLSVLKTGPIMNKKSRKKLLQKIEKQALQKTSIQTILDRAAPVDMNLPSKEYARQVFRSITNAVADTIDDDFDRLIAELEAEDQQ